MGIIATVLLVLFGVGYCLLGYNLRFLNWAVEAMTESANRIGMKEESDLQGKRTYLKRDHKRAVRVNLYDSSNTENRTPLFLAFDGKFTGGDADEADEFCAELQKYLSLPVISVAYTKIDVHVTTYPQDEIADTVRYFRKHAAEYDFDMNNYAMIGFGAGAYLSLIAATALVQDNVIPSGLIFVDPFVDYVAVSFVKAGMHPGPVSLITTREQSGNRKIDEYEEAMIQYNLPYSRKNFLHHDLRDLIAKESEDEQIRLRKQDFLSCIREKLELFYSPGFHA